MGAEIEQLPDLAGYLKLASRAAWLRVRLAPLAAAPGLPTEPAHGVQHRAPRALPVIPPAPAPAAARDVADYERS